MPSGFRLGVAALVGVFINGHENVAAGAHILFTNSKLPSILSESVPRSGSEAKHIQLRGKK